MFLLARFEHTISSLINCYYSTCPSSNFQEILKLFINQKTTPTHISSYRPFWLENFFLRHWCFSKISWVFAPENYLQWSHFVSLSWIQTHNMLSGTLWTSITVPALGVVTFRRFCKSSPTKRQSWLTFQAEDLLVRNLFLHNWYFGKIS